MFASRFLTDELFFFPSGLAIAGVATTYGTAMPFGGTPPNPWRKLGLLFLGPQGTGSLTLGFQYSRGPGGPWTTIVAPSNNASTATMTMTGINNIFYAELRGEVFPDLNVDWNPYVRIMATVATAAVAGNNVAIGFLVGDKPPGVSPSAPTFPAGTLNFQQLTVM